MNNEYLSILLINHNKILDDIAINYNDKNTIIYFEIYFIFYLLTKYVYRPKINTTEIKNIFIQWLDKTMTINKHLIKNFIIHYDYLFRIFFIEKNIYFHTYFNNLIKYFLPLPYEFNTYSSIITYRNNVNTFYKKNNIDYLFNNDKLTNFDLINLEEENIDIHIPIKYFHTKIFKKYDIIYLIAKTNNCLYICNKQKKILYTRSYNMNDLSTYYDKFKNKLPFEFIFPLWIKNNNGNELLDFDNIIYISVLKKIILNDLFNVFKKIDFTINKYHNLYHNSLLSDKEINSVNFLNKSMFFYPIPTTKSNYFKFEKKRRCISFKIIKNINNLLDLNNFVGLNNDFTKSIINRDREKKIWISYDPLKTNEYYSKGSIPTKFDENFKCITIKNTNIVDRVYCDKYYGGRKRLREILYKTKKYSAKHIYYINYNDSNIDKYKLNKIYHPPNIPINQSWDFDKYILNDLNCTGFFSNDFGDALDGGELLLIKPSLFISLIKISNNPCYIKH
jgi:hypothetical protein